MTLFDRLRQSITALSGKASASHGGQAYHHGAALFAHAGPRWSGRSHEALIREGYLGNVIAYRAVRLIAECAASVPLIARRDGEPVEQDPALDLIGAPNMAQGREDFLEQLYGWLMVAGNAYVERVDDPDGTAIELHLLRPDRMAAIAGPRGWPEAYEFRLGGFAHRFPLDAATGQGPVLHLKNFHPLDDHYGHAALRTAATAIDIHNAASGWNKALLDNAARPSGALVFEPTDGMPGNLSEEQLSRLRAEMEAQFQGAMNAGRPLLLEGGLKWQQMAFSPSDMDFINLKHVAAREIALAFGVPPMLLGIPGDNTFANYQEANRALWRLTLLPLIERVTSALGRWLSGADAPLLRLSPDRDAIPALAVEREALWARVGAAGFLTLNEQRAAVGLGPVEGGDVLASAQTGDAPSPFELRGRGAPGREWKGQAVRATRAARFADLKRDFEAAKADGKTHKIWRTVGDGAVRSSHDGMDGVRIAIDEDFMVAGERLFLPSDPAGSFNQTANCRCFVEYVGEGSEADQTVGDTPSTPIRRGEKAVLTDEDVANIVFNESASLSGPDINAARKAIAHAIINADERFGARRPRTASKSIGRQLPPLEQGILADIRSLVLEVQRERREGMDPALGNNFFNFRDATDPKFPNGEKDVRSQPKTFANGVKQPVVTSFGPLFNSNPRPEDRMFGNDGVFLVILEGDGRFVR